MRKGYEKPEMMILTQNELEEMLLANASGCGYVCMVSGR